MACLALENFLELYASEISADLREDTHASAQITVEALTAIRALDGETFKAYLPKFYPLLTSLIRCEDKSSELSNALCDLFTDHVGPLLLDRVAMS